MGERICTRRGCYERIHFVRSRASGRLVACDIDLHAAAPGETVLTVDGEHRTGSDTSAPWGFTQHWQTCGRRRRGGELSAAAVHERCQAIKERLGIEGKPQ